MNSSKHFAAESFECNLKSVKSFTINDPFQHGLQVEGYKCRKEGKFGGSLYLTRVNGFFLDEPQLIYGTPSLSYPYTIASWKTKNKKSLQNLSDQATGDSTFDHVHKGLKYLSKFEGAKKYYLSCKYNGSNILFWKYTDDEGKVRISAKTKGSATVNDTEYGDFLSLTYRALGLEQYEPLDPERDTFPPILQPLLQESVQSMSFELCGRLEPHLVDYQFPIALKPLFFILKDGSIKPFVSETSVTNEKPAQWQHNHSIEELASVTGFGPYDFTTAEDLVTQCKTLQQLCVTCNEAFRKKNNLKHKYEYFHFITEGFVLYILGSDRTTVVPARTMYKVKPVDIEEVHWEKFDDQKKQQVVEAVRKLNQREKPLNERSLREELDIQDKEWGKFGREIQRFIQGLFAKKSNPRRSN